MTLTGFIPTTIALLRLIPLMNERGARYGTMRLINAHERGIRRARAGL
jgi:hypothetical protein